MFKVTKHSKLRIGHAEQSILKKKKKSLESLKGTLGRVKRSNKGEDLPRATQ